jgi:hypothetical protein
VGNLDRDKLVEKIFTEGIGACQAFLVVLSATSVQKKWVREELNSGVVEAIERQVKLLPIRIDDCEAWLLSVGILAPISTSNCHTQVGLIMLAPFWDSIPRKT